MCETRLIRTICIHRVDVAVPDKCDLCAIRRPGQEPVVIRVRQALERSGFLLVQLAFMDTTANRRGVLATNLRIGSINSAFDCRIIRRHCAGTNVRRGSHILRRFSSNRCRGLFMPI